MVCLSTCPRCQRMVTLPEGADAATLVRCPLCGAEFSLSEAMALIPPALIVVPAAAQRSSPAVATAAAAGLVTEPFFFDGSTIAPPTDREDETAAGPLERPEFSTSPTARLELHPPMRESQLEQESGPAEDFVLDFEEHLAESEPFPDEAEEPAEIPGMALDTGEYSLAGDKPSATGLQKINAPEKPKEPPRAKPLLKPLPLPRKRKKRSFLGMAFGWIFGGCLSVALAYYGIWWIKGESAGLPRFDWLPGLPAEGYGAPPLPKHLPPAMNANAAPQAGLNGEKQATVDQQTPSEQPSKTLPPPTVEGGEIPIPGLDSGTTPPAEAAKPTPLPTVGPRVPENYSFFDFDNALQEVTDAFFKTSKMNVESYPAFCRLAQVRTFIAPVKLAPAQRKGVQELLSNIAKDPEQIAEIGRLAAEAVKNAGEQPGGIMLAGKVKVVRASDGMFGGIIELAGGGGTVKVFSAKPFGFQVDDEVLILGGMIAKPAENIDGFKGTSPLVVWFGEMVPVPAAK